MLLVTPGPDAEPWPTLGPQVCDFVEDRGIYGPGSNVVECAADMLVLLGHNMPPVEA